MAGQALMSDPIFQKVLQSEKNRSPAIAYHATEVVRAAHQEIESLLRQRREIAKRISALKQTLVGLTSIFDCSVSAESLSGTTMHNTRSPQMAGLANACRIVLKQANEPLQPHQVRDRLRFQGLSLENHRDPVAAVASVLRKLGRYGEARGVILPDGKRAWQWVATESGKDVAEPE